MFTNGPSTEFFHYLHDTDIAWFEWCDDLVATASRHPKMCKSICRLHSYEMFTDQPKKVDWNKIDKLLLVNDLVQDYCTQKFQIPAYKTAVIHNGVNTDRFQIPDGKKYNKKVVFVGFINYKKGPALLLQAFKAIHDFDPEFTFHIAGEHQDERISLYFQSMQKKLPFEIHMDGWVKDVPTYLEDKDFVISTSLFESFQYSLAEGMAQGCVPLIHGWPGSEIFYPKNFLWDFPDECVNIVEQMHNQTSEEQFKTRERVRKHIVENFSVEKQVEEVKALIESL